MRRSGFFVLLFLCSLAGAGTEAPKVVVFFDGNYREIVSLEYHGTAVVFEDLDRVVHTVPAALIDSEATAVVNRYVGRLADQCSKGRAFVAEPIAGNGKVAFERLAFEHFPLCEHHFGVETPTPQPSPQVTPTPTATAAPEPQTDTIHLVSGAVVEASVIQINAKDIKAQRPGNSSVELFPQDRVVKVVFRSGLVQIFPGSYPRPVAEFNGVKVYDNAEDIKALGLQPATPEFRLSIGSRFSGEKGREACVISLTRRAALRGAKYMLICKVERGRHGRTIMRAAFFIPGSTGN